MGHPGNSWFQEQEGRRAEEQLSGRGGKPFWRKVPSPGSPFPKTFTRAGGEGSPLQSRGRLSGLPLNQSARVGGSHGRRNAFQVKRPSWIPLQSYLQPLRLRGSMGISERTDKRKKRSLWKEDGARGREESFSPASSLPPTPQLSYTHTACDPRCEPDQKDPEHSSRPARYHLQCSRGASSSPNPGQGSPRIAFRMLCGLSPHQANASSRA